ncbi:type II toxin-antitoxin system Phd/YefM family antitoxin [Enterovirga sp. CN4-39]|uniref:type II toxin-antitoxin system Phd/YefM family antitoxin n=1 Tax=Enterovirga sp. CN4-39 TaxID=3400910 RepID=UPI003C0B808D
MAIVSFTELRANMASHFDRLVADRDELVVTRQNREPVVIMPLAELESLRETLHLLSSEENARRLRQSVKELDRGEGVVVDSLPDP